jgi:hypothetical protein
VDDTVAAGDTASVGECATVVEVVLGIVIGVVIEIVDGFVVEGVVMTGRLLLSVGAAHAQSTRAASAVRTTNAFRVGAMVCGRRCIVRR